jgi:predicted nucleic acid-binding protein
MARSSAELFIDTDAFIARYDKADQHHAAASAAWAELAPPDGRWRLVTSSGVLGETFTLLGRRAGFPFAAKVARAILDSPSFTIHWSDAGLAGAALALFTKFADQSVSWVDCESFAIMRSHRIAKAFTFDRHFDDAGFHRWAG